VAFELLFLKTITLLHSVLSLHPLFLAKVLLLEEVYLLRSPINSKRLFEAIEWSEQKLAEPLESKSLEQLRQELETELEQETAPTI